MFMIFFVLNEIIPENNVHLKYETYLFLCVEINSNYTGI